ncbi:MAG: hypothetical protein ABIS01_09250 [Ferruginibacter sp.]
MKQILIFLIIVMVHASCNTTQYLHQSGAYTIKNREGDVTEFYEVKGKYNVISDTLKENDKIIINVIKAGNFKRSGKMKNDFAKSF